MMMYHPTKFGCNRISSSEDTIESYFDMNPCCDLDPENSKSVFLRDTLAHDDASPYQLLLSVYAHSVVLGLVICHMKQTYLVQMPRD